MALPVVKGPGGKRYKLPEGMKQHFISLYGEWPRGNGTVMCPPLFPRDFISPVDDLPGVAPLKSNVLDTIRGDDAEEKIFDILKEFGEREKQPMFVLTKLKFTEFIKYCMRADQTIEHDFQAEIDFAIVHLNIGVILVEVKATKKWPKQKAFNQLLDGEKIIKGLLPKDSSIPVYKVVALPNMDGCPGFCKNDFFILKKLDLGSCKEFSYWMDSHLDVKEFSSLEKQELHTLLYKLVGQRTKVASSLETIEFSDDVHPKKVNSKCFKNICSQECLRQRCESASAKEKQKKQKSGNRSCLPQQTALVKTADRPGLAELAKEVVFLNSEQLCVWEGEHKQLIDGPPGSGKTILLQYKALECARKGEKVIVFVPSPLVKLYEAFFEEKSISGTVTICTFKDLKKWLIEKKEEYHLFVDELQLLSPVQLFYLNNLLRKKKSCKKYYWWISFDVTQCSFNDDVVYLQPVQGPKGCFLKGYLFNPFGLAQPPLVQQTSCLKTVMRSTEHIFKFVNDYVQRNEYFRSHSASEMLESCNWTKKDWQVTIGHRVGGPKIQEYETDSVNAVLDKIFTELPLWRPKEIAVLGEMNWLLENLSEMCRLLKIPVCSVGENEDAIVIDHGSKAHSYEWPLVIAVTRPSKHRVLESRPLINYLIFSRAVVKLIVFNVVVEDKEFHKELSDYMEFKALILKTIFVHTDSDRTLDKLLSVWKRYQNCVKHLDYNVYGCNCSKLFDALFCDDFYEFETLLY